MIGRLHLAPHVSVEGNAEHEFLCGHTGLARPTNASGTDHTTTHCLPARRRNDQDVITDLARYKDLLVIARNSTLAYKGKPVDARQVAKDLNVRYVLTGSIQHQADQVRVTAELVDTASGAQVWSERWDRPAQDLFSIQAEVADKVAISIGGNGGSNPGVIQGRLLSEAKKRAPAIFPPRFMVACPRATILIIRPNPKGLKYVDEAIGLDPNFAPAYATRAWLKMQKYWIFGVPVGYADKESKTTCGRRCRSTV